MNNDRPFFTIIIPTYNRARLIAETLQTVLDQEFQDFEIIIADDGSIDDTSEVVAKINSNKISYFKTENKGVAHARNFGILKAKGNYIGFLDSDDFYEKDHLQNAFEFIQTEDYPELVHLNFNWGDREKKAFRKNKLPQTLPDDIFVGCSLHVNSLFVRKDIGQLNLFNESRALMLSEDWEYFIRMACRYQLHLKDTPSSYLVEHSTRSTRIFDPQQLLNRRAAIVKCLEGDQIISEKYPRKVKLVDAHMSSLAAVNFAANKSKTDAFLLWVRAIRLNPKELFTRRSVAIIKHLLLKF
ncbi:MAG: hypothetical protein K0S53_1789 [Bacteroidetes bacterium]|jgi:glycosyltransferase involved in cell wall biosynthesis|nr:hypothetical protein [Bacteroidota bacterium]MDF2452268.1 hypothetical protein [Bacteroidota bacterium]